MRRIVLLIVPLALVLAACGTDDVSSLEVEGVDGAGEDPVGAGDGADEPDGDVVVSDEPEDDGADPSDDGDVPLEDDGEDRELDGAVDGEASQEAPDASDEPDRVVMEELPEEEALARQLRRYVVGSQDELDLGWIVTPGNWEESDALGEVSAATPGAAAFAWAEQMADPEGLGLEATELAVRVADAQEADEVLAVVAVYGYRDDSVGGTDWRLTLASGDDGQWTVTAVEERVQCSRGATDEGLCV